MGIRKNVAALTAAERTAFVAAVKKLKAKTTGRNYDWFVNTHMTYFGTVNGHNYAHWSSSFLPWHRKFLLEFEKGLQAFDSTVTLPYWNWVNEQSLTGPPFTDDFMGGNGRDGSGPVTTGPFAGEANWRINVSPSTAKSLYRAIGRSGSLPTAADVQTILDVGTYDVAPWTSASNDGMRNRLEGGLSPSPHGRVHVWVGGHMAQTDSPNDPLFFLHHCNIDRIWSRWQNRWGYGAARYQPGGGTANVVDVDEALAPFTATVADVVDHRGSYTYT
ncbi:tyrosinase family protein [Bailinhaonella thermotolerans]|uniref:Tyrosinase family protein n=1 Tax=Bailinhaonella thermotolerans TaxID=1070861 RepID=A0A3A4AZS3_9ACTN|nr:tyrosinase family protein [Bailinhaonella thermotolerans]RJL35897.1 tyrosinase family protein [Bailinhaonella thermotolerans]